MYGVGVRLLGCYKPVVIMVSEPVWPYVDDGIHSNLIVMELDRGNMLELVAHDTSS